MDKQMVFQHYCNLLDEMRESSLAFQSFLIAPGDADISYWTFQNAEMNCGATRAAILDADNSYPYIVKFDIDTDEWGDSSSEREVATYHEAKLCGLESCFVEAKYLGEYRRKFTSYRVGDALYSEMDNEDFLAFVKKYDIKEEEFEISIPLYGYERADLMPRRNLESSPEDKNWIRKYDSPLTDRSFKVGIEFFKDYGRDMFERLTDFCRTFNINDLHLGNVGYINDKIVIIDFGSYHNYSDC